jgi:hypothetical protein
MPANAHLRSFARTDSRATRTPLTNTRGAVFIAGMGTIQANDNPGSRMQVGSTVLERAKGVGTKAVAAKLRTFQQSHAAYAAAHAAALGVEEKLHAAQAAIAEADDVQDDAVTALAAKMIGDGAPKANPFKPFGLKPPSDINGSAVAIEVKTTKKLAKLAASWKPGGAATKKAARTLASAVTRVEGAMTKTSPFEKAHVAALTKRNALGVSWERAMAKLKRAARVADDDGAGGIYATLFGAEPAHHAKRKSPAGAPPAPPGTVPPAATGT